MDRLDRIDLTDAPFDVALRGYDKRQVDERIRLIVGDLAAAEHALRATQARAANLEDEVNKVRSGVADVSLPTGSVRLESNFGARVEKILMAAEDEAREVRNQAGAEASALVEQARMETDEQRRRATQESAARHAEAEKISATAAQEAALLRHTAAQEADQVRAIAAKEADDLRKAAQGEAAQLVEQARIEADRIVGSATESAQQRERASAHELQRLSRLRDQVNAELYRAKNMLDNFFPAMAKPAGEIRVIEQDGQSSMSSRR